MATATQPNRLMDIINSIARGAPQAVTGFVDLAGLPFTASGLLDPKQVVGSTAYLTQKGLLPPPSQSLLGQSVEAISGGLMPLSPAAMRATQAGIEATAKAVAPQASIALENYMARQGLIQPLTAYHGTPHTIQGQFDINKVGTGEGAQAYGHGMYFAENPAVAAEYRKNLSPTYIKKIDGQLYDSSNPEHLASHYVDMFAKRGKSADEIVKILVEEGGTEAHKIAANIIKKGNVKPISTEQGGNLYKVDIPDADIPFMLDYDKPFEKQSKEVKEILKSSGIYKQYKENLSNFATPMQTRNKNARGENIQAFVEYLAGSPEKATEMLNSLGIKGVRYLDEGSRSKGKGTSNFVVFDPADVKILEKNSEKVEGLLD
jgi:hypothetical protein